MSDIFDFSDLRPGPPEALSASHPVRGASVLQSLEQAWWALAGPRALPRRADITAQVIGQALPYAFIAERIAPGHARLRIAGRRISALVGCEARGMPLSCVMAADQRALFATRLETAFARPAIVDLPVASPRGIGRPALSGRLLLLPLAGHDPDDAPAPMALGALLVDGAYGAKPRRLRLDAEAAWRCDPVTRPPAPALHALQGGARLRRAHSTRPAGLRLVVDNG